MGRDLAVALWREGYRAIPGARGAVGGARSFTVRLLGRRAVVVGGADGARLFYDSSRVERRRAVPRVIGALLFGRGAVHGLDGAAHARRKRVFLQVLSADAVDALSDRVSRRLDGVVTEWEHRPRVVVFDELVQVYGQTVLEWAGIRCRQDQAARVSRDLAAIIDGFGGAGIAYPRAWAARRRTNRWALQLIRSVRAGRVHPDPDSALAVFAHQEAAQLGDELAAVELVNILRPTVAVAWFGSFAALALHEHPQWRPRLVGDHAREDRDSFTHEVRRYYPFVPALVGRARRPLEWQGQRLSKHSRVLFDVPGTNQDPHAWTAPDRFEPERFASGLPNEFQLVPQGGGDPATGHRCPGEPLTVGLLGVTLEHLARIEYDVAPSGRSFPDHRIPTLPVNRLVATNVRRAAADG